MLETSIRVENLSKRYRIGLKGNRQETFAGTITNWLKAPIENLRQLRQLNTFDDNSHEADDIIWALRNISFEIKQGEVLGIIGANGAGKSTLLKVLTRITEPTSGRAIINGRIASLLEVGTGFHPELTGRENIYLNGTILGMTKQEVDKKFAEIVDFSGVGKFLDTPVKRYSSGMKVRLAFSVAGHLEPEILLVDEVLAVGDATFQRKSLGKMGKVAAEGRTVVFVSHDMSAISRLCKRVIWIDKGKIVADGPTESVITKYLASDAKVDTLRVWHGGIARPGITEFKLHSIQVKNDQNIPASTVDSRKPFWIEVEYEVFEPLSHCRVAVTLATQVGVHVFTSFDSDNDLDMQPRMPGRYIGRCKIPGYLLNPNRYVISCEGTTHYKTFIRIANVLQFEVDELGYDESYLVNEKRSGAIRPKLEWGLEELNPVKKEKMLL